MSPAVVALVAALAVLAWPGPRAPWLPGGTSGEAETIDPPVPVPEVLDLAALSLAGGGALAEGLAATALSLPPAQRDELLAVVEALRGRGTDAWDGLAPEWAPLRRCVELAATAGIAPSAALLHAARDLRAESTARLEIAAARLGVRLVLPLGLCFLPAFVLVTVAPLVLALTRQIAW